MLRVSLFAIVLAALSCACSGNTTDCADLVDRFARVLELPDDAERRREQVADCETSPPSAEVQRCIRESTTRVDLQTCIRIAGKEN